MIRVCQCLVLKGRQTGHLCAWCAFVVVVVVVGVVVVDRSLFFHNSSASWKNGATERERETWERKKQFLIEQHLSRGTDMLIGYHQLYKIIRTRKQRFVTFWRHEKRKKKSNGSKIHENNDQSDKCFRLMNISFRLLKKSSESNEKNSGTKVKSVSFFFWYFKCLITEHTYFSVLSLMNPLTVFFSPCSFTTQFEGDWDRFGCKSKYFTVDFFK